MKLTIFNGSPRGKKGNTEILINKFLDGFDDGDNSFSVNYLNQKSKMREFVGKFQNADNILIAFPLYTDSMPGIVKEFIEALENVKFYTQNQRIGFIVHCGFPETAHVRPIEKYLIKLSQRFGIQYVGTIAKGGTEGLRVTPEKINKKLFSQISLLGKKFSKTRSFDADLLKKIAANEKFPAAIIPVLKLLNYTGLFDIYWNKQLKQNDAFDKRFDKPYDK